MDINSYGDFTLGFRLQADEIMWFYQKRTFPMKMYSLFLNKFIECSSTAVKSLFSNIINNTSHVVTTINHVLIQVLSFTEDQRLIIHLD